MTVVDQVLRTTGWANGGDAVARDDSGRVVFVAGALPDELVAVDLESERKRFARARVTEVIEASVDRATPTCPHLASGCGGCDLAHVRPPARQDYARTVVADVLGRTGGVDQPNVEVAKPTPVLGGRTTVRCLVEDGRAAYRKARSHVAVAVDSCEIAHPLVEELIAEGDFGEASQVTMRAGARTGERLVVVEPTAAGVRVPAQTLVVGDDELAAGRRAWIHEEVAGRRWRISARSFFQSRPDGAERLVETVRLAVDAAPAGPLVDLYSGVGLLAGTMAEERRVQAVESSPSAVSDARKNLADRRVRIIRARVEKWKPSTAAVIVADPPRSGLGAAGVGRIDATSAARAVLVSCDAGALGRDTKLLRETGFDHRSSTVLDMFPQTSRLEVVSVFDR